jgi:hypothetical protein
MVVKVALFAGLVCVSLAGTSAAAAQSRPAAAQPAGPPDGFQTHHEITVLEGVLETAVQYGAQMLNRRLLAAASAPDVVLLSGVARARGFRLDGYGVFFDVEFPALRRSVVWSFRTLDRPDPAFVSAIQDLRRSMQSVTDPQTRQMLDQTLKLLEARTRPARGTPGAPSGGIAASSTAAVGAPSPGVAQGDAANMDDPGAVYLAEVKSALIDAMLEHAGPIDIAPDEWLTVAARESDDHRLVPGDPGDAATTLILRLRGSDLAALRKGRLAGEDVRKRVEVREY